jgi:glycosyltransferase involved in cell wall biosynthesis
VVVDQPPLPTIAIATFAFNTGSETFVRRHLQYLNGGNTVGLAQRPDGAASFGKPLLGWHRPGKFRRLLRRLDRRPLLPGLPADPFGKALQDFAAANGVGFLLAEFGTVGVDLFEAAAESGIPMFCYFRGFDASKKLSDGRYRRNLGRMFDKIDGIVAVSQFLLEQLAAVGLRHANAMVIPSGVDCEMFAPGDKDPDLVLNVGRLVEKKAPLTTIRAFAEVARAHPSLRLEMIGSGDLFDSTVAEARALGVADRVQFHGARDQAFVAERMRHAAIYMQHSVTGQDGSTEGAPTSIQEAMAAGAVVVSTRHAGIPDLIAEGRTGLLVAEHDEAGYAAALGRLVAQPELRASMAREARAFAIENLDYRVLYGRLERAIGAAIAARR